MAHLRWFIQKPGPAYLCAYFIQRQNHILLQILFPKKEPEHLFLRGSLASSLPFPAPDVVKHTASGCREGKGTRCTLQTAWSLPQVASEQALI